MSIVVAAKVGEGLVLAADSATSIILQSSDGPAKIGNIFLYTRKLLHLKDYPIGILTWGLGSIGQRSIESLVKEYEDGKPSISDKSSNNYDPDYQYDVQAISEELRKFLCGYYERMYENVKVESQIPLGMYVGGFSRRRFFADEYAFVIPFDTASQNVSPALPDGSPTFGAHSFGLNDAITRFTHGYDERLEDVLKSKGFDQNAIQEILEPLQYEITFSGMPLQDAIDFAVSLVQLTIARYRFVIGPQVCGGEIDVAVLTNRYFNWVHRKSWKT
jgi:hypothetical protein